MTQEDKELLLKDFYTRSAHGLIINVRDTFPCTVLPSFNIRLQSCVSILSIIEPIFNTKDKLIKRVIKEHTEYLEFKPYLRPMSSMTEEEIVEINSMGFAYWTTMINNDLRARGPMSLLDAIITHHKMVKLIDWLNAHHFDYRGLIEKGIALEAPEGMYKIK